MKKIIIVLLLLIPLIVLFTLSVSGKIISAEVAISIENVELWHKGEKVTQATVNLSEYKKKNLKYQLIPRYYPGVAQVSGFKWISDNPQIATVSEDGIVSFLDCGFVKITAISSDVTSVRASCTFFVEDDVIHSITPYSYETGEKLSSLSMQVYEQKQIRLDIAPYNALVGDPTVTSSDPSVLAVTSSGVLKAQKQGVCTLTMQAKSQNGTTVTSTLPVTVAGTALLKQPVVYAYGSDDFDLTDYLASGSVQGGNVISLAAIPMGGSADFTVSDGARSEKLTVRRLAYKKMLGIDAMDVLLQGEWKDGVMLAAGRSLTLTPVDLATAQQADGVEIRTSDANVLAVAQGTIKALAAGKATLSFRKAGYEEFTLEMEVATPISYFALNFDSDNDVVGLGSERVFGTKSMYDGAVVNGIRVIPEQIYPETGSKNLFAYSVDERYATIDESGLLTFLDTAIGQEVTVTVKSLFSTNAISRTYTFRHVVKGINVGFGYGDNTFNAEKNEQPSFAPYYDAVKMMDEDRNLALVFQTNVYLPDRETIAAIQGNYQMITLIRDIYGNGYKLDGQFYQYDYESHIFAGTDDKQLEDWQKGITITDLFINSYAPVGDDSEKTFAALMEKGGEPIRSFYKKRTDFCITFRYCAFQYAYSHACLIGGTFVFDGCVFRNSAGVALMIQSLHGQENNVTINNCIFSNSISMTGTVSNGDFPSEEGAEIRYNQVNWTGENYIYNWKKIDEIRLDIIPRGLMKNDLLDTLLDSANDKLSECARVSFNNKMNSQLVVTDGEDQYVNMGIFFMGFWAPVNPIINEERKNVTDGTALTVDGTYASFSELKLNATPLGTVRAMLSDLLDFGAKNYMLTNYNEQDGTFNTAPGETYKLDQKTYERLKGKTK